MTTPAAVVADRIARGGDGCARRWSCALDLARLRDVCALVCIESVQPPAGGAETHTIRFASTWPRGEKLTQVIADTVDVLCAIEIVRADAVVLGFDRGGVGLGVADLLHERLPSHAMPQAITWTGAAEARRDEFGAWTVPTSAAVNELVLMLEHGTLRISRQLEGADRLLAELASLRARFTKRGTTSVELPRTREGHSDLASACLGAVWICARGGFDIRQQIRWSGGEPTAPTLFERVRRGATFDPKAAASDAPPLASPIAHPPPRPPRTSRPGILGRLLRRSSRWGRTDSLYKD